MLISKQCKTKNWLVTGFFDDITVETLKNFTNDSLEAIIDLRYSSEILPNPSKTACKWLVAQLNKLCDPFPCKVLIICNLKSNIVGEYENGEYHEHTLN